MKRTRLFIFTLLIAMLMSVISVAPALTQGETLTIWADVTRAEVILELGEEYTEETGITIEVREIGLGDARDELLNFGEAGEGPDILIQPHDNIGQLVANGAIVPMQLPTDLEEQFITSALNLFTYQDELWAVPYAVENVALIRNTDLVPEAPATWEEVAEISRNLRESGDAEFGFLMRTGDAYHSFPIISAFGGYIFGFNDDGSYNVADIGLNSDGGLAAAQWMADLYADELMVPNVDDDVSRELFAAGDLAMWITGPWNSEEITNSGVPFSIDPIPGSEFAGIEVGSPFIGGQGFMISAFSENQLLAEEFLLNFIATPDSMEALAERVPVFAGVESSDPNIAAFIAAGETGVPMPVIPEMSSVWGAAGDALTNVSLGENPIDSFETAVVQIEESIEEAASGAVNTVNLPGSFNDQFGCDGPWIPSCEATELTDMGDGIWSGTFSIAAGEYEFKIAINGDWPENYGVDGELDGANYTLVLEEDSEVTFTYDRATNLVEVEIN